MSAPKDKRKLRTVTDFLDDMYRLEASLRVLHGYVHRVVDDPELPELFASDLAFQLDDARRLVSSLASELFESGPRDGPFADCELKGGSA